MQDTVDTRAGSRPMQLRTGHGSVQHRHLNVLVNLFQLSVNRPSLYHYDVSFDKQRSSRSQAPGEQAAMVCSELTPFWVRLCVWPVPAVATLAQMAVE